jgi:hypothetical protein
MIPEYLDRPADGGFHPERLKIVNKYKRLGWVLIRLIRAGLVSSPNMINNLLPGRGAGCGECSRHDTMKTERVSGGTL